MTEILPPQVIREVAQNPATFHGAADDWDVLKMWVESQNSEKTKLLYRRAGGKLLEFLAPRGGLPAATLADWRDFTSALEDRYKRHSAITMENACRSLFMFCQRCDYIYKSPAHVTKAPQRQDRKSTKELTEDEVLSLIGAPARKRDKVLLELLYVTGIRAEEAATILWKDCRQVGHHVIVQVLGKGGKTRSLKLPKGASRRFMELKSINNEPGDAVFTSVGPPHPHPWPPMKPGSFNYIVREAARKSGIIKDVSPHWFRHAYAQHARAKGQTKDDIQDALGHASQTTTEGYLAAVEGMMLSQDFITERE